MRVACWLECPSQHWRREDRLSLGALVYPMQHCAPAFIFQLHPKIPPSLLTLPYACVVAHSSFLVCGHPGTRYHFS